MSELLSSPTATVFDVRTLARGGMLYAILDACDAPAVPPKVESLGEARGVSLYKGTSQERYADIAPYLVAVDDELLDWILTTLWSEPWGMFAQTKASIDELRTHFRKFLIATGPNGEEWYFRFYDPRVLTKYLPTCTDGELRDFFGPVTAYGVADPDAGVRWTRLATARPRSQISKHPRARGSP